jgi:tetratricopeptide (TPR) repeat protein
VQVPGRLPDAIAEYEAALRLNPGDADIHFNLATALVRAGRTADAIAQYEAALRIKPGMEQARQMVDRLRAVR